MVFNFNALARTCRTAGSVQLNQVNGKYIHLTFSVTTTSHDIKRLLGSSFILEAFVIGTVFLMYSTW